MFPDELEKAFATCPVIYFAYGLCEPHGPQNVLGLDGLKAHSIACKAAKKYGGIVAPPDFWHIHEVACYGLFGSIAVGEVARKWLTAVPPSVHFKNICYHIRTADALGAHAAILLTGHYGPNWKDLKTLIELIQPYVGTRLYGLPDFEANTPGFDNDGKSSGDHAGKVETSLMMALDSACSDMTRLPSKDNRGRHWAMGRDAYDSNRQVGERMVSDEVAYLGEKAGELLSEYKRIQPKHTFRTFEDVERTWKAIIAPELNGFHCLQPDFEEKGRSVSKDSVWYENLRDPNCC